MTNRLLSRLTKRRYRPQATPRLRGRASSILVAALAIVSAVAIPPLAIAAPDDIQTFAGAAGCSNVGPATNACLAGPYGLATDSMGNLLIADTASHRIYRVDTDGNIAPFAGNGNSDFCGDGGSATAACLNAPAGVTIDGLGNVFIADTLNHRVRKVDNAGSITTLAGNGTAGFCGDTGPAISACLDSPLGLAVDGSGNVFVSDTNNNRIRKVDALGTISTVAGDGSASFCGDSGAATSACLNSPRGISLDSSGNLYIADTLNHRVRRVSTTGTITTRAGSGTQGFCGDLGPATSACLNSPTSVTVTGALYIADSLNYRVRRVEPSGSINTVAGTGIPDYCGDGLSNSRCIAPVGLHVDPSFNFYISDSHNRRVYKLATVEQPDGSSNWAERQIITVAGNGSPAYCEGDGADATTACFKTPIDIAFDASGNLYIADKGNHRIRKITPSGVVSTVAGTGTPGFQHNDALLQPVCPGDGGPATGACLNSPSGVAVDSAGNLYIADTQNHRVRRVSTSGVITTVAGNGLSNWGTACNDGQSATNACLTSPTGVIVDSSGNLFISDAASSSSRVIRVTSGFLFLVAGKGTPGYQHNDAMGRVVCPGDGVPARVACLNSPMGLAIDSSGNLLIADYSNNRIRKVTPAVSTGFNSVISTFAGNGSAGFCGESVPGPQACLNRPADVSFDSFGSLMFTDSGNNRIRRISTSGTIHMVSGSGSFGFCGDGGPSINACYGDPRGIAFDSSGNMYIADSFNDRIRRVEPAPPWSYPVLTATKVGGGTGTITSSIAGINCGSLCWKDYVPGTQLTLTATPDSDFLFLGWSGACSGTGNCVVTMDSSKTVTARFDIPTLTVTRSGSGAGTVASSPAGIDCGSVCSSTFPAQTVVTLSATPNNSTFGGWSGACSGTGSCSVTMSASKSVNATFITNPLLTVVKSGTGAGTVTSDPSGISCPPTCGAYYPTGTEISLTPTPGANSTFEGWSGACSGTGSCVVSLNESKSVGVVFKAYPVLTVSKFYSTGSAGGDVTSSPSGINCGSACVASYPPGTTVTLTATAAANSHFVGWSGACSGTGSCVVTMDQSKSVSAAFTPHPTLTVSKRGTGMGTVASDDLSIDCGAQCSATYLTGTTVTLTATASAGSVFTGWSGTAPCSGTGPCVVTLNESKLVTATFHLLPVATLCGLVQLPFVC